MRAWMIVVCALVLTVASEADAQDAAALATRRALVEQAQQARDAGDHAQALDLAERAGRIQMTPSLRLLIAQEHAALGHAADAFGHAEQCARDAERDSALRNREVILATCRALATELRDSIATVVVRAPQPPPADLRVVVAGRELPDAFWGVPYIVTAGRVVVEATATGHDDFRVELDIAGGATMEAEIVLARTSSRGASEPSAALDTGPIVLWAVGGAGLVASGAFLAWHMVELGTCNGGCPDQATIDRAYVSAALSWTALGIGVLSAGAGLVWWLLGSGSQDEPRATLTLSPSADGVRVRVDGWF